MSVVEGLLRSGIERHCWQRRALCHTDWASPICWSIGMQMPEQAQVTYGLRSGPNEDIPPPFVLPNHHCVATRTHAPAPPPLWTVVATWEPSPCRWGTHCCIPSCARSLTRFSNQSAPNQIRSAKVSLGKASTHAAEWKRLRQANATAFPRLAIHSESRTVFPSITSTVDEPLEL